MINGPISGLSRSTVTTLKKMDTFLNNLSINLYLCFTKVEIDEPSAGKFGCPGLGAVETVEAVAE